MSSKKDIAEYYDTTLTHYKRWWKLDKNLSLHYGIWEKGIKNFNEALINTNKVLMELSSISESDRVLDAGCGVGGAAMFLNSQTNTTVVGISLSENHIEFANKVASERNLLGKVSFQVMDYTSTIFEDESFDVVWACESVCHANPIESFIKEAYRVLKRGGRLILSDFFLGNQNQPDPNNWLKKWWKLWGVPGLITADSFEESCLKTGFLDIKLLDYTSKIVKGARRMYLTSLLGAIPSEIYNITHPGVSKYAKNHYKSGYFQFKALKEGLWKYYVVLAYK